jgi:hypothetical protein
MADRFEPAPTGRAKCRACGGNIEKGALRFGVELASGYGEGDATSTFWFHPRCAAQRQPEKFLPVAQTAELPDREALIAEAQLGIAHPELPKLAGAERASSGRARCRQCRELIPEGAWRLRLSSFADTGFFDPLGFVHAACARDHFGLVPPQDRLRALSPALDDAALAEAVAAMG